MFLNGLNDGIPVTGQVLDPITLIRSHERFLKVINSDQQIVSDAFQFLPAPMDFAKQVRPYQPREADQGDEEWG